MTTMRDRRSRRRISYTDDEFSDDGFEPLPRPLNKHIGHLKVDGKIPEVLHVIKYLDYGSRVIECRQSSQPFKEIPEYKATAEGDGDGDESKTSEKPILEIVTNVRVDASILPRRWLSVPDEPPIPNRRYRSPPIDSSRPLSETPVHHARRDAVPECYYPSDDENVEATGQASGSPGMVIHSEHLINALKAVISYYPKVELDGSCIKIKAPYQVLYHHRKELQEYMSAQPVTHSAEYAETTSHHIQVLLNFLEENLGEDIRREQVRNNLSRPMATFDLFWLLLKPGDVFYAKRYDIWTPFVASSTRSSAGSSKHSVYKVKGWMLETDGVKIKRYSYRVIIPYWQGEQAIDTLPVIPAAFWKDDPKSQMGMGMRDFNVHLGKMYWELLKRPTYMDYEGILVNSHPRSLDLKSPTGFMRGRVICDAPGYDMYHDMCAMPRHFNGSYSPDQNPNDKFTRVGNDHLPQNSPRCGCLACLDHHPTDNNSAFVGFEGLDPFVDTPPENELFYFVCSSSIPGFILGDRRWGHLNIANLKPVKPDVDAFNYLVLDDSIKKTVKALVGKFATELSEGKLTPWGNDFVKNKGEGRIFLLHGAPGVGKTCTAECVAELANRPLITLTSGDLGAFHCVEGNLSYFLELGQRYGALVLLDEADVYLERRRPRDLERNGLVSIFLRALEYYRGVLFLTTNRVRAFDGAFLSRIHVALHYRNLRDEDRERIWANTFDRLARDSQGRIHVSNAARELVWSSPDVSSLNWNGREIRNAMQTALALAESEAEEDGMTTITVTEKHIREVVDLSRGFKTYMQGVDDNDDYGHD